MRANIMHRWKFVIIAVLGLGAFATGIACGDIGESLQDEECYTDADCGPLLCVVPIPPQAVPAEDGPKTNVTGIGWCRDESTCAVGAQPFCTCSVDASSNYVCASSGDYNRLVSATQPCLTAETGGTCFCVPVDIQCSWPAT